MEISLALGGGGAKGIAHIGVLRCLERAGIRVAAMAGSSAGGTVAALFAAGYGLDEILERFKKLDFSQMYRHVPVGEKYVTTKQPELMQAAHWNHKLSRYLSNRGWKPAP